MNGVICENNDNDNQQYNNNINNVIMKKWNEEK